MLTALRADSEGAPSTHAMAKQMGGPWPGAEAKELNNHHSNGSWVLVECVPKGRRVHRMVWVYKTKRDGTWRIASLDQRPDGEFRRAQQVARCHGG